MTTPYPNNIETIYPNIKNNNPNNSSNNRRTSVNNIRNKNITSNFNNFTRPSPFPRNNSLRTENKSLPPMHTNENERRSMLRLYTLFSIARKGAFTSWPSNQALTNLSQQLQNAIQNTRSRNQIQPRADFKKRSAPTTVLATAARAKKAQAARSNARRNALNRLRRGTPNRLGGTSNGLRGMEVGA